jgi:hypothetical protein
VLGYRDHAADCPVRLRGGGSAGWVPVRGMIPVPEHTVRDGTGRHRDDMRSCPPRCPLPRPAGQGQASEEIALLLAPIQSILFTRQR